MLYGPIHNGWNCTLVIVEHHSQHGSVNRFPTTLVTFVIAVITVLALSAWFVMAQRAVPDTLPHGVHRAQIVTSNVSALVVAPEALRPVSTQQAEALNAEIPLSTAPNPAAAAMYVPLGDGTNWMRSLDCLTAAVYYEAATEGLDGQRAVAQVVLNRTRHPSFPHTVCGVVFQGSERKTGCQFTFTCDGALMRVPIRRLWLQARAVADAALAGYVYAPVGWATHYHTNYVAPYWAPTLAKAAIVGAHIFYRWPGGAGRPSAFTARYAGMEPLIDRSLAGSRLPGLPSFVGMADPNMAGASTTTLPVERSVLPFAGGRRGGAVPAQAQAATAQRTTAYPAGIAPARWVIGQRTSASAAPTAPRNDASMPKTDTPAAAAVH